MKTTNRLQELETILNEKCDSLCYECKHKKECEEYKDLYIEESKKTEYIGANRIFKGKKICDYNVDDIRALTIDEAFLIADDMQEIKGHKIFFINFYGYFGYSYLVFLNGKHLYYADNMQLHNRTCATIEKLKERYINYLQNKIFTLDELQTVKDYDDYTKKGYYLRNYYTQQFESLSMFGVFNTEEQIQAHEEKKKNFPFRCDISFAYYKDKNIVKEIEAISAKLENAWKSIENNNEVFRHSIRYELQNHEACITCDPTDALMALGLKYSMLDDEKKRIVDEELKKEVYRYDYA